VTADGVILSTSVLQAPGSAPTTSLSAIWSPAGRKDLTLNGFVTGTGAISLGATATSFLGVPGLQASLLASPPNVLSSGQLTLDYLYGFRGHARAVITPNPKSLTSPTVDLSATYRLSDTWTAGLASGVDMATKTATNWSAGAVWLNPRGVEVGGAVTLGSACKQGGQVDCHGVRGAQQPCVTDGSCCKSITCSHMPLQLTAAPFLIYCLMQQLQVVCQTCSAQQQHSQSACAAPAGVLP
jgi:hypothetical protein